MELKALRVQGICGSYKSSSVRGVGLSYPENNVLIVAPHLAGNDLRDVFVRFHDSHSICTLI
jgi:hypothetical protein